MYKKPKTLVKVTWGDAWGSSGWAGKDPSQDNHKPVVVVSVGFVIKHDAQGISLAEGLDDSDNFLGMGFIPAGMVKKVTKIG